MPWTKTIEVTCGKCGLVFQIGSKKFPPRWVTCEKCHNRNTRRMTFRKLEGAEFDSVKPFTVGTEITVPEKPLVEKGESVEMQVEDVSVELPKKEEPQKDVAGKMATPPIESLGSLWNAILVSQGFRSLSADEAKTIGKATEEILEKYAPAVGKYSAELNFGVCVLAIVLPRIMEGRKVKKKSVTSEEAASPQPSNSPPTTDVAASLDAGDSSLNEMERQAKREREKMLHGDNRD